MNKMTTTPLTDALRQKYPGQACGYTELLESHQRLEENIRSVIDHIPPENVVRCCEGGGPESIEGTLALSVLNLIVTMKDAQKVNEQWKIKYEQVHELWNIDNCKRMWQPIDTAPVDGTVFLAFVPHSQEGYSFACTHSTNNRWVCMMSGDTQKPTHWMEIPPAP